MIRLLLADDHPVVRAGLRALFAAEPDIEIVAEAATAEDAVAACARTGADVVLMDLQFGQAGRDSAARQQGVDATRALCADDDAPHVLILTNYDTDADILSAVEAGASGYLLKDAPPAELVAAVRAAAAGESALAPSVADRLTGLVAAGKSNRDIGGQLFLSEATVKSHLVHIFTKLGVGSRTSAVARARELGAIRPWS